jgi:hypothetical protein
MIFFVDRPTNRGSWNLTTKQKCYTIVKSCHKLKKIQACGLNAVTRQNPNFLYRLKKIYLLGKRPYFFMIRWLLMNTSHIQASLAVRSIFWFWSRLNSRDDELILRSNSNNWVWSGLKFLRSNSKSFFSQFAPSTGQYNKLTYISSSCLTASLTKIIM